MKLNNKSSISQNFKPLTKVEFEALFARFYAKVVAYATVMLDDRESGEDIAQEVFVYVWENRNRLSFAEGFHSYLFQTAYTKCLDYIRRNQLMNNYVDNFSKSFIDEYRSYLDNESHTLQNIFSKDFEQHLDELLKQLSEPRRMVFKMIYNDGFKVKEVSEKLQMPIRTVESHIYLTMKYLRKHLSVSDFLVFMLFIELF